METNKLHWKIAGAAGQGIKSAGQMFAKVCTRGGLHAFGYTEYPSLIRGGHNTYQVRVEERPVSTLVRQINFLVALNKDGVMHHLQELAAGAIVLYDAERVNISIDSLQRPDVQFISVPTLKLSKALAVAELMENQMFLGASFALVKYDFSYVQDVIVSEFAVKGDEVVQENLAAAKAGYDFVQEHIDIDACQHRLVPLENPEKKMFLSGNDALALGAAKAGCKFFAAYPMTPASSILHMLASLQHDYGLVVKHVEDEIAAVNMAIGAGFAGVRAMTATSGGGFALMSESLSLAAMTETPLVVVEAQRAGPATGLPTWTEQADLQFVVSAGHGDFPRFVIAPGDPEECFYMIADAFNIADEYQSPVVVMTDKYLAESFWTYPFFTKDVPIRRGPWVTDDALKDLASQGARFKRYDVATSTGVSTRVVPGQHKNGIFTANSDEHDEYGYSTEEVAMRNAMFAKRQRKLATFAKSMPQPRVYGPVDAELTIICWGSTKTIALQALEWLTDEGRSVNVLHLSYVSPFPTKKVMDVMQRAKVTLNVEHNATAQMAQLIRKHTGLSVDNYLLKNDGRPLLPEEVADKVRELVAITSSVGDAQ